MALDYSPSRCACCGNTFVNPSSTSRFCSHKCADTTRECRINAPWTRIVKSINHRRRKEKFEINVTEPHVRDAMVSQKYACPFTGWEFCLDSSSDNPLRRPSPDRIDNSVGYVVGNVRFVTQMANYGRRLFKDDDLIAMCRAVIDKTLPCPYEVQHLSSNFIRRVRSTWTSLSREYLEELWKLQNYRCALTGWKISFDQNSPCQVLASLDRIDSTRPYSVGNVQFVSYIVNCAKNRFTLGQFNEFCAAVNHNTSGRRISPTYCRREYHSNPFVYFTSLPSIRGTDVTVDGIENMWKLQLGRCASTGLKLELPACSNDYSSIKRSARASIRRIDPSKPFANSNIKFVSVAQ